MSKLTVALIGYLIAVPPVSADQRCLPAPLDTNLRGFEKRLAETYPAVSKGRAKSASCTEDASSRYADCEFFDEKGVQSLVEGSEVIRVEVNAPNAPAVSLPFGIWFGQSPDVVKQKLVAVVNGKGAVREIKNEDQVLVVAYQECLSSGDQQYEMYWVFNGERRLIKFGLREPW